MYFDSPPVLPILAQSDRWVVVAKPSGLMVHRSEARVPDRFFALQLVRDQVGARVFPVHRLDRGTSGALIFALDSEMARTLQEALASPDTHKTYVALVRGAWKREGWVEVANPMRDDNGFMKEARSRVRGLGASTEPRVSLLEVHPFTGRYHQVRRHVRDLTHPVVNDSVHGDTRFNRVWREATGMERLGLHALSLHLPLGDDSLEVSCPLPPDFSEVLQKMPWWEEATQLLPALSSPWFA